MRTVFYSPSLSRRRRPGRVPPSQQSRPFRDLQQIRLNIRAFNVQNGPPRQEQDVGLCLEANPVEPKRLAQETLGAGAIDRAAKRPLAGGHAKPPCRVGRRPDVQDQEAAPERTLLRERVLEIVGTAQTQRARQSGRRTQTGVRRARPLRRRRARTARPPGVAMRARKPTLLFRFLFDG
jgi:hypothetical protein